MLLKILIIDAKNLLKEIGFSKKDIIQLSSQLKNIFFEEHEYYLVYVKDEEESIIEKILNKRMENEMTILNK